jgi:hypothetical protein
VCVSVFSEKSSKKKTREEMNQLFIRYREQREHARIKDVLREIEREEDDDDDIHIDDVLLDHLAFRTFKSKRSGHFVDVKQLLLEKLNYRESGETLVFPKKKLKATWLKPPNALMPRVFLSEIDVEAFEDEKMSAIVRKAISSREEKGAEGQVSEEDFWEQKRDAFSLCENVSKEEYDYVAAKSEYAAWLLINGPEFVNHFALAMHRCRSEAFRVTSGEEMSTKIVEKIGKIAKLNGEEENKVMNVSEDKKLWQFSTVSDEFIAENGAGEKLKGCGAYIEFAYREYVLPYSEKNNTSAEIRMGRKNLEEDESKRRDGFEVANADAIFESTKV